MNRDEPPRLGPDIDGRICLAAGTAVIGTLILWTIIALVVWWSWSPMP